MSSGMRWLALTLVVVAARGQAGEDVADPLAGKSPEEVEVIRQNQKTACASPTGWVQVPFKNTLMLVRCQRTAPAAASGAGAQKAEAPQKNKEGYQKARWGMAVAEVKRLYPDARARRHGNVLWFSGTVEGFRAVTSFHFSRGELSSVILSFHPPDGELGEPACFERLHRDLSAKYGSPAPGGDENTWETEESRIRLSLDTAATLNRLTITYFRKGPGGPEDEPGSADPNEL